MVVASLLLIAYKSWTADPWPVIGDILVFMNVIGCIIAILGLFEEDSLNNFSTFKIPKRTAKKSKTINRIVKLLNIENYDPFLKDSELLSEAFNFDNPSILGDEVSRLLESVRRPHPSGGEIKFLVRVEIHEFLNQAKDIEVGSEWYSNKIREHGGGAGYLSMIIHNGRDIVIFINFYVDEEDSTCSFLGSEVVDLSLDFLKTHQKEFQIIADEVTRTLNTKANCGHFVAEIQPH